MGRLPSSFRQRNKTTRDFREQYADLPDEIKEATLDSCILFDRDPSHPSLRRHELKDLKKGHHQPNSFSVSITMQYRAIYLVGEDGVNVWYWIGTHAAYKRYTGSPR